MRSKTRFIQRQYSTNTDHGSDYLLIVEIVKGVPAASYNVRVPASITCLPLLSQFKN